MEIVLGILILVAALFLVVAVLMQSGSSKRLSGTISGAAETFFGKNKGKTIDRILGKLTNVVAIVFAVLVLASFLVVNRAGSSAEETPETTTTAAVTEISTSSEATTTTALSSTTSVTSAEQ